MAKTNSSKKTKIVGKVYNEELWHFRCGACNHWWTIADASVGNADKKRTKYFCPWCGLEQLFKYA